MSRRIIDAVRPVWQSARSYLRKKFYIGDDYQPYIPPKDFRSWPGERNATINVPPVPPGQEYDIHKRQPHDNKDEDPEPIHGLSWPNHVPKANWERDDETLDWLLRKSLTTGVIHYGKNVIRPGDYIDVTDEKARDYLKVKLPETMEPTRQSEMPEPLPMSVLIRLEQQDKQRKQDLQQIKDLLQQKQHNQQQQQQH